MNEAVLKMVLNMLGLDAAQVQKFLNEVGPIIKAERERHARMEAMLLQILAKLSEQPEKEPI